MGIERERATFQKKRVERERERESVCIGVS